MEPSVEWTGGITFFVSFHDESGEMYRRLPLAIRIEYLDQRASDGLINGRGCALRSDPTLG